MRILSVKKVMEHYELFLDNEFYCSCDINEVDDEIKKVKKIYCNIEINML